MIKYFKNTRRFLASFLSLMVIIGMIPAMQDTASATTAALGHDFFVLTTPFELQGGTAANNFKVEWSQVEGAESYTLYRSDSDDGAYTELVTSPATKYDDYDLEISATYYYKVEANGPSGVIASSNIAPAKAIVESGTGMSLYDNTKVSSLKLKSNLLFDGIYYRYSFQSDGSGFTQIIEQTSSDGFNFRGDRVILEKADHADLTANKFEAVNIVKHGAEVVMWAHYENNADYTLARVASISGTPGGDFTYHGSFQPHGNQSRDLNFFEDDDGSGYLISSSDNNETMKLYKLNDDWTNVLSATEFPAVTILKNEHREAPSMIKKDGWYYLFTSEAAGWYPSQGKYISAQSIEGLADASPRLIGNTSTFGAQSGGIVKIGDNYVMMGNRWSGGWATPDPALNGAWSSQRMLPITLNEGFAAYDYYSSIKYNVDDGVIIPVQSGKNLSINKPTLLSSDAAGADGFTADKANDGISYDKENYYNPRVTSGTYTWTVDLLQESVISQIDVTFKIVKGSETYSQYVLSGSRDGINFTTIKDKTNNKVIGFNENIISDPNKYRYIRIQITGVKRASDNSDLNADWTRGFHELTVYGTPPVSTYTSIPVGETWYDTDGTPIQAHGGGFLQHDGWYYWVGEDKTTNNHNTNGINLYRSQDLLNWEFVSTILSNTTNPGYRTDAIPGLIDPGTKKFNTERPKLLYNAESDKFVLWAHWENGDHYGDAHLVVASADTVDGHYTIHRNFRPGVGFVGHADQEDSSYTGGDGKWGYASRDFTVYMDPDTGEGYLVNAQDWTTMRLYKLTEGFTNVDWENSYPLFIEGRREAPAMIKTDGGYYLITSGQSGWQPNQAMYAYTTDLEDPEGWSELKPLGNNTTFYSQPTNIMEIETVDGSKKYVYMGDHWNPAALGTSTYMWQPLNVDSATNTMTITYASGWSFDSATGDFIVPNVSLVSQGKPVIGEDNVVAGKLLEYINDGLYDEFDTWADTPYYQQNKVPYAVTFDLEAVYDLSRVDISFKQHNGSESYYGYTIQGSNDNLNWTLLADETNNKQVGFMSNTLKGKYRYVKLNVTSVRNTHNNNSTADWSNGILEAQIYANNLSQDIVSLPESSVDGGTYTSDQTIELSSPTDGARIYYTTSGAEPTDQSELYTSPIELTFGHTILKAVAYADDMERSGVMTIEYRIIDPSTIVSVSSPTEFAVTSDEAAAGLPATLEAVNALGNTITAPVTWNTTGISFIPYTSVKITGTMDGGYEVNATVDVVNSDTTYFISSGSQGSPASVSSFFAAAKARLGDQLVNDVSDQAYDGQWGYTGTIGTDIGYRIGTGGIYEIGWYAYGDKSIDYTLHLDHGTYTVISGYKEWWNATRNMSFSAQDAEGKVFASKEFSINKDTTARQEKIQFTLDEAEDVKISVSKVSGSDPVLAWIAVEGLTAASVEAPIGLTASDVTEDSLKLSWVATDEATGYNVYRSDLEYGTYVKVNASELSRTEFVDGGLNANTTYFYKVTALYDEEESAKSAVVAVKTKNIIIDPDIIVAIISPTEFAVTADVGAADLPATLEAVNAIGNTVTAPVTWNINGIDFNPYTTVSVTGVLYGGYEVNATVDVVNADTAYFISAGSQRNSTFFAAVKARLGDQLVNEVSDQAYDGQWGYTGTIGTDIGYRTPDTSSIYDIGWYAYENKSIDYTVHLKPGTYTLISGHKEWWTATRNMKLSAIDSNGDELASKEFSINKETTAHQEMIEFTLDEADDVQISVSKVDGGDPVLAWLAIERQALDFVEAPTDLALSQASVSSLKLSWTATDGATGYNVYRSNSAEGAYVKVNASKLTETEYVDSGLSANTTYYYKVTALYSEEESVKSAAVEAKTKAASVTPVDPTPPVVGNPDSGTSIQTGAGSISAKVPADANGALQVQLAADDVKKALGSATHPSTLDIKVEASDGESVKSAKVSIPVQEIAGSEDVNTVMVSMGGVKVSFDTAVSAGILTGNSKQVELSIQQVDAFDLPVSVREQVGNRPVYDFALSVDGVAVSKFIGDQPVTIEMEYKLQPGEKAHQIVVYYIGDNGTLEIVQNVKYDAAKGIISFAPKHFSRYAAVHANIVFTDIQDAAWAQTIIETLAAREIVRGTGEGVFEPSRAVTRAEFAQLLLGALGLVDEQASSSLKDVKQGAWYYSAVASAEKLGIVKGKADGTFGANESITREDMAVILARATEFAGINGTAEGVGQSFKDQEDISRYALESVKAMQEAGYINGFADGSYRPKQDTTRAQAASVIFKLLKL